MTPFIPWGLMWVDEKGFHMEKYFVRSPEYLEGMAQIWRRNTRIRLNRNAAKSERKRRNRRAGR